MGIRIIKNSNGGYRPWWYAEYRDEGRLRSIRLEVKITGAPPKSLSVRDTGDIRFEKSKMLAQKAFDDFLECRQRKGASEEILEELIESKTGAKVQYVKLDELAERWNGMTRTRPLTELRKQINAHTFSEFAASCGCTYLYQVRQEHVKRYFDGIREKLAWSSVKSRMSLLSGAFKRFLPHGSQNPFSTIIKRDTSEDACTIHRYPLTNEEVRKVLLEAKKDPFLYPLVVCAVCTGARLTDICHMRKDNIDLDEGFVTFVASKTNTKCDLPLFPEFRKVCESIINSSDPTEPHLFPEAAAMYDHNRSGIVRLGKLLIGRSLAPDDIGEKPTLVIDGNTVCDKTPAEILILLDSQGFMEKKLKRIKDVYARYVIHNQSYRTIAAETGIPRQSICGYLQEIETLTGQKIIRFKAGASGTRNQLQWTRQKRSEAKRAVSIYGWASFRATFCILAINHHIPEKEIIKAVGHSTFKTTMEHYNNPTRAHIREMWQENMSQTVIGANESNHSTFDVPKFVATLNSAQKAELLAELQRHCLQADKPLSLCWRMP